MSKEHKHQNENEEHDELATEPQPTNEAQDIPAAEAATEAADTAPNADAAKPADDSAAKIEELKDKYLRLFADFDNYKKRVAKERLELIKEAGKDVIMNLLPVLDDFERAMKAAEKSEDVVAVKEGLKLIHGKLNKNLEQKGLKPMETQGKDFDSSFHEAITEVPAGDELKGKVVDEVEKGYYLNDKIIRYAKVVVGK